MSTQIARRVFYQEGSTGTSVMRLNAQVEEMQQFIIDDGYVFDSFHLHHGFNNRYSGGVLDDGYVFDSFDMHHGFNNSGGVLGRIQESILDDGYIFDSLDFGQINNNTENTNGRVFGVKPATPVSIQNLERVTIDGMGESSSSGADSNSSMSECSICLGVLSIGSIAIRMPNPCCHVFHEGCIIRWLNTSNTCPLCRRSI